LKKINIQEKVIGKRKEESWQSQFTVAVYNNNWQEQPLQKIASDFSQ